MLHLPYLLLAFGINAIWNSASVWLDYLINCLIITIGSLMFIYCAAIQCCWLLPNIPKWFLFLSQISFVYAHCCHHFSDRFALYLYRYCIVSSLSLSLISACYTFIPENLYMFGKCPASCHSIHIEGTTSRLKVKPYSNHEGWKEQSNLDL